MISEFLTESVVPKLVGSIFLVALAIGLRVFAARIVLRQMAPSDMRRRWIVNIRNTILLLAAIGLAAMWLDELRSFATAVVAFAVALVLATKEFILCLNGSALRAATNAYSVGDRIEIGGHRGDVIDFNLLTTTLLEVGPGRLYHLRTGRTIVVPNSKLLDSYLVNESYMKKYVVHVFSVSLTSTQDWKEAETVLLEEAQEECKPFLEEARSHMSRLEEEHGLQGLLVSPRVYLQIPEAGKIDLLVRIPAPLGRQGAVEQEILRRFLGRFKETDGPPKSAT